MPLDIQSNLPLTEATYFILLSLAPGPRHGYAIMKDVHAMSKGRIMLSTGTLYGALKRLLDQRWILRTDEPGSNGSGRERKAYCLTQLGRHILSAEIERLDSLVAAAHLHALEDCL
ncbi:MAG: PadR family transcriptional regulator [Chloroflexota bacterium]